MTKTSQLNDIAIMIYHGGYPVLKNINFLVFCHYFDENHMKKEIVLLLRPMTKTSQLNDISGNSKEDVSDAYSVKWPFKMSA